VTYQARDQRLGHRVAIKELFVDGSTRRGATVFAPTSLGTKEFGETKSRFLDEAKALAHFRNPGIVRVLNFFEDNNTAYLVMEFLEGRTVGAQIEEQGTLGAGAVERIAVATAQTLVAVHKAGLLHRDIKPDNIFLEKSNRVVLIDFGSVRSFAPGKTMSHTRLVTPGYAPLEQYGTAAKFGPYTDIYALGATLYHALTGKMPPPATDLMLGTPLPPLPRGTPAPLRRAVEQAMAVKVADRPQSADAFLELLKPAPPPPPKPKPAPPDALVTYLRQQNLTEPQLRNRLYEGTLDPAQLPSPVRQMLIQKQWLNAAGQVPEHLRRTAARPAPSPAEVLAAYLRKQGLTETQLQNQLYEGYVNPDGLPQDVRQILMRMNWLDHRGKVPDSKRRQIPRPAPTPPASPFPRPKPSRGQTLATYLRTQDMTEDQLQTWLYDGSLKPKNLPEDIRLLLIQKGWLDQKGRVSRKSRRAASTSASSVPLWPKADAKSSSSGSKANLPFSRGSRRPFRTTLNWTASLAGMGFCALALAQSRPVAEAVGEYLIGGSVGLVGGFVVSELAWWLLPLLLPVLSAYGAYFFAQRADLLPAYVLGLSVLAAALSLGFVKAVRRI